MLRWIIKIVDGLLGRSSAHVREKPGLGQFHTALKNGFFLLDTAHYPQAVTACGEFFFLFRWTADGYEADESSIRRRDDGDLETAIVAQQLGRHFRSMHAAQDFTAEPSLIPGPYRARLARASEIAAFLENIASQRNTPAYRAGVAKVVAQDRDD